MSCSSPHLGYYYSQSKLVDMGMWYMKKQKNNVSLNQMAMTDHSQYQNTFLYTLSKTGSLQHFQNIVLLSSHQDDYVPFESARITRVEPDGT